MPNPKLEEILKEIENLDQFKTELGKLVLNHLMSEANNYDDLKRIAIRPLALKNANDALEGELIMDPDTAITYTKKNGKIISGAKKLLELMNEGYDSTNGANYIIHNNRFVYRFYFISGLARLDPHLTYPKAAKYFRIRDVTDKAKYYVHNLTEVNKAANAVDLFVDNGVYFVEFYNPDQEYISTILFTAKFAPSVIINNEQAGKTFSHIEVTANKSTMYIGEDPDSYLVRVMAHYDDGSTRDVTESSRTYINRTELDTTTVGVREIKVIYIYDITTGKQAEESIYVNVIREEYSSITRLIVTPKKIINLNDGSKEIRLSIIAYYDNGTVRDVTNECVISNNFKDDLFNETQLITIKFNAGRTNTVEKNYEFMVKDDGSVTDNKIYFNDNILKVDDQYILDPEYRYYRVRHANRIDFYYTPTFNEVNYDALYNDVTEPDKMLKDGMNVIVEFYTVSKKLVYSLPMAAYYKENI